MVESLENSKFLDPLVYHPQGGWQYAYMYELKA